MTTTTDTASKAEPPGSAWRARRPSIGTSWKMHLTSTEAGDYLGSNG